MEQRVSNVMTHIPIRNTGILHHIHSFEGMGVVGGCTYIADFQNHAGTVSFGKERQQLSPFVLLWSFLFPHTFCVCF